MQVFYICSVLLFLGLTYGQDFNYTQCSEDVLSGKFGTQGTVDINGHPTNNLSLIGGYLYPDCVRNCGGGSEYSDYNDFWAQATLWFLPWFVLVSQIPCFTKDKGTDILIMVYSVGSPTTALYSLFVTTLDRHWLKAKCIAVRERYPREDVRNMLKHISQVLGSLHQFPIEIEEVGLVACTLALPENRHWWRKLGTWFAARQRKMEASAYAQLVLVIVLYCFAVLPDAFMNLGGM